MVDLLVLREEGVLGSYLDRRMAEILKGLREADDLIVRGLDAVPHFFQVSRLI